MALLATVPSRYLIEDNEDEDDHDDDNEELKEVETFDFLPGLVDPTGVGAHGAFLPTPLPGTPPAH